MEQLLIKAAVTPATDQGEFTAVISTASLDRDGDIVEPQAMINSFQKWAVIGKSMPLAWNHTKEIVGHINPGSAHIKDGEVVTQGWVDQSTPRGQEAWRLVKSGTLSFSYGMLFNTKTASKLPNGGFHIKELDLYEVSVIPIAPANNDTRVLSWKAMAKPEDALLEAIDFVREALADDKLQQETKDKALEQVKALVPADVTDPEPEAPSVDPLRKQAREAALRVLSKGVQPPKQAPPEPEPQPDSEMDPAALRAYSRDLIVSILSGGH